jgi:hypothetical protein
MCRLFLRGVPTMITILPLRYPAEIYRSLLGPVAWQDDMAALEYLARIGEIQSAFPQRDFPLHLIEADFHEIKGITFNLPRQG